ncbi:MAG TPA: hypothetical protein VJG32_22000 [Anaerolineae bacterium]|nr:hypothetical protein [Anaerolineae bacterium]
MLEHLRQRVIQTLAGIRTATLSTYGPAGLQASRLPCEAFETELYVLVPRASDHLFNLETQPEVTVVNETWNVKGITDLLLPAEWPCHLALTSRPEAGWSTLIRIRPSRLTILALESGSPVETIDLD